jgi:uncharacterized protein YkwD
MPATLVQALGFLLGVFLAIVLLTPLGARGDTGSPAFTVTTTQSSTEAERLTRLETALHETVNEWRQGRNLIRLLRMPELDDVARRHSEDMATRGYFSHETPEGANPVDRILAGGVGDFSLAAENVGMTSRARPNAEVFGGWLHSKDHYENLSAPAFNATGIGIARRADGTLYYTQVYVTFPR